MYVKGMKVLVTTNHDRGGAEISYFDKLPAVGVVISGGRDLFHVSIGGKTQMIVPYQCQPVEDKPLKVEDFL